MTEIDGTPQGGTIPETHTATLVHEEDERYWMRAPGGDTFDLVDPYSRLALCTLVRNPCYDLREGSFTEGWRNLMPRLREKPFEGENRCRRCGLISVCVQCPGWAQLEHGNPEAPVDYLCQVAHLRAEAFGIVPKALGEPLNR